MQYFHIFYSYNSGYINIKTSLHAPSCLTNKLFCWISWVDGWKNIIEFILGQKMLCSQDVRFSCYAHASLVREVSVLILFIPGLRLTLLTCVGNNEIPYDRQLLKACTKSDLRLSKFLSLPYIWVLVLYINHFKPVSNYSNKNNCAE